MLGPMFHQDNSVVGEMEEVFNPAFPTSIVYPNMHENCLGKDKVCRNNMGNGLGDVARLHHASETRMALHEQLQLFGRDVDATQMKRWVKRMKVGQVIASTTSNFQDRLWP